MSIPNDPAATPPALPALPDDPGEGAAAADLPVVAVGASAGGLAAFRTLLHHLPADTGMAYVLIQHLAPDHPSLLTELLEKDCPMPVSLITDGMVMVANRVHVIAPGQRLTLLHNRLHCLPGGQDTRPHYPVDTFFKALAQDRGSRAIGVILSGTASDGTLGCRAIKEAGGITFAQDRDSAEYDAMPANAVAAGYVDFVLPPTQIARELARFARHPLLRAGVAARQPEQLVPISPDQANKIFILLRARVGHDFSLYKDTTIKRRIARRMLLHKLADAARYLQLLQHDPRELDALFQDILINVTSFFRDPHSFEALRQIAFPTLLSGRPADTPLRIWVPGCSTGQEVYSIAMVLHEVLNDRGNAPRVQIFGSDIDDEAIAVGRAGIYPEGIEEEVSPARLQRYFHRVAGGWQVSKPLREQCVFATQNVTRDPPFSRLDLVSCRNLLIYLETVLQRRVLQLFHYALQPGGFLLLGTSETIGNQAELFSLAEKSAKLYRKKSATLRLGDEVMLRTERPATAAATAASAPREARIYDLERETERRLLERYAPAGVVIGSDQGILRFLGRTWPYIEPTAGTPSLNLFKLAHPDLLMELRTAVHTVSRQGGETRRDGVRFHVQGETRRVDIVVLSLGGAIRGESNLLVLFEPCPAPAAEPAPASAADGADADPTLLIQLRRCNAELEQELSGTRDNMKSIIEEQEDTNEALRAANEEVQSANEELQSANEEMETAKEELQSANEELATVNEELENRNAELARINNDLINLLISVDLPILILGADLRIRQFTQAAERLLNLIPTDVGRPIGNIKANIDIPDCERFVLDVIATMNTRLLELKDQQGHWYSIRIRPYKTIDNRIDGAILVFIAIDDVKDVERLREALREERRLAAVVRDSNDAVTVQDLNGIIRAWNPAATRIYGFTEAEAIGTRAMDLVAAPDRPRFAQLLTDIQQGRPQPGPLELRRVARDGRTLRVSWYASVLVDEAGAAVAIATTERPCVAPPIPDAV